MVVQELSVVKELNKASGVWSMQSQFQAKQQGTWPKDNYITLNYLVVAGGGGGQVLELVIAGGGGAGGYRASGFGPSPLQGTAATVIFMEQDLHSNNWSWWWSKGSPGGNSCGTDGNNLTFFETITSTSVVEVEQVLQNGYSGGSGGGTGRCNPWWSR